MITYFNQLTAIVCIKTLPLLFSSIVCDLHCINTNNAVFSHSEILYMCLYVLLCVFPQLCVCGMMALVTQCPFSEPCCLLTTPQLVQPKKEGVEQGVGQNRKTHSWPDKQRKMEKGNMVEGDRSCVKEWWWYFTGTLPTSTPAVSLEKLSAGRTTLESLLSELMPDLALRKHTHTYTGRKRKVERES